MQLIQDQLQKKNDELITLYQERCKKHTQMTNLYNLLKSRAMRSQIQTAASDSVSQTLKSLPHAENIAPLNGSSLPRTATTASRHFDALPLTDKRRVKNSSTESLFRHQRSGSASSKSKEDRFMTDVGVMAPQLPISGTKDLILIDMPRVLSWLRTLVARNLVPTPVHHRTRLPAQPESTVLRGNRGLMEEPKYFANHGRVRDFTYNPGWTVRMTYLSMQEVVALLIWRHLTVVIILAQMHSCSYVCKWRRNNRFTNPSPRYD